MNAATDLMTDINKIRLDNARTLSSRFSTIASFADRIDRAPTQVSRFMGKNPTKNIGSGMARHIEECFSLPNGWMDQIHDDTAKYETREPTPEHQSTLHTLLTSDSDDIDLLRSVITTIEEILEEEQLALTPEQKAQAIIGCLKTCLNRGQRLATEKNVASAAIHSVI